MIVHPHRLAETWLRQAGVKFSDLYSVSTGEINKRELAKIYAFSPTLYLNVLETLRRLNKSENPEIQFNRNLKNTLVGSMAREIVEKAAQAEQRGKPTIIKWMPSTAKEPDAYHSRFYGRTMTLKSAKDLGLGIRYGCKCGFQVLSGVADFKSTLKETKG